MKLKLKADAFYIGFLLFFLIFGLLCVAAGCLGLGLFSSVDKFSTIILANVTLANNTTSVGPFPISCNQLGNLVNSSIALSISWLLYGFGIVVIVGFAVYAEFFQRGVRESTCDIALVLISCICFIVGFFGFWSVVPVWVYLQGVNGVCASSSAFFDLFDFTIAATVVFSINNSILLLSICCSMC